MRTVRLSIIISAICFLALSGMGTDYYVSTAGNDTNSGTIENPWRTITHAFAVINPQGPQRDNLYIATGLYEEDLSFKPFVNVYGGFRTDTWERQTDWFPTLLKKTDGTSFILQNEILLDGLVIYNGLVCDGVSPTISGCRLMMANSTGITCKNSALPLITNCSIKECAGNGIEIASNSSPSIENTVIAMNGGDGVHIAAGCRPNLNHVTIGHNISAGIRSGDSNVPLIKNSIIWENSPDLVNCHTTGSCVGDGDDYPGNSTEDPLFFGYGGFNEYQPIYVATYGSDTGSGDVSTPLRHIRQALALYSYNLTSNSPQIKKALDGKDRGAYPSPDSYLTWFGNAPKVYIVPGNFEEQNVIVTAPASIVGMDKNGCVVNAGGSDGFLWRTDGKISALTINQAKTAITQNSGSLQVSSVLISGASETGIVCLSGTADMEEVTVEKCNANGLSLTGVSPHLKNSRFRENGTSGLHCAGHSSPHIDSCTFEDNASGIFMTGNGSPDVHNSTFSRNFQYGIVATDEVTPTILSSRIHHNYIGIFGVSASRLFIASNLIYDNLQKGIKLGNSCHAFIINNTICFNKTGIAACDAAQAQIQNCILRENSEENLTGCSAMYSNISNATLINGNFDADPQFLDAATRDLHIAQTSPCVDSGLNQTLAFRDIDGEPRPTGLGVDVGADETTAEWQFSFEQDSQDWKTFAIPQAFTSPTFQATNSALILSCLNNNTFGFWDSPPGAMPADENHLYRIRLDIRGSVEDKSKSPGFRFRAMARDSQWVDELAVFSQESGLASPPQNGRTYDLYVAPTTRDPLFPLELNDLTLNWDIVNLDQNDASQASVFLDDVRFSCLPLDGLQTMTLEKRYEFTSNAEGWTASSAGIFTPPNSYYINGTLVMQSLNNLSCFGYWETLLSGFTFNPSRLYRIDFTLRTSATPAKVPSVRLRISTEDYCFNLSKMLNSTADASVTLRANDRTYSCYFVPPVEYTGIALNRLRLACDLINFNDDDDPDALIAIERVAIYSCPLPQFQ